MTFNSGGAFTATAGTMTVERHRHSATLLQDGKVLLAGGQNSTSVNTSAEVYDPSFGTFAATAGTMTTPRDSHTGTLLNSGKVLIAGGIDGNVVSGTAELFDPASGLFTPTGPMTTKRVFHTATLLQNGRVLIAGGFNGTYLNTAELYDTATGTFRSTAGVMSSARSGHTATLLSDGRVLIAGGINSSDSVETAALNTADIYDPSSDTFAPVANPLNGARTNHTATLLSDGTVLLTGGTGPCTTCCPTGSSSTSCPGALNTTEIFDPAAQTFAQGPTMTVARSGHAATYLQSTTAGYVRVSCPPGMAFSETYGGTGDIGMINGIEVSKYAGITKLYSPQFANTPAFSTRLNLINANTNNKDAQVTITLHGPDGKVLGTPLDLTIPRNGQLEDNIDNIFANDPAIKNATGWLEVDSSIDQVVGTVTFTDADSVILTSLELSGNPRTNLVFPIVAEDATYETGVALLNTNSSAANVTVELWGPNGTINRSTTISVAPGTRTAEFLSDFFPGLSALLVGNIRVHSDQPIHSFGLMMDRDLNFVLAIPAVPFPAAP